MPGGYAPENVVLSTSSPAAYGASLTNQVVSKEFRISPGGSCRLVLALDTSAVTAGAGITAKLQTAVDDFTWVDSKTVAVTATGDFYIKLAIEIAADQTFLPLLAKGRVVVTTGAGSAVTFDAIWVLQED